MDTLIQIKRGTIAENDNSVGSSAWVNPSNCLVDDGNSATALGASNFLKVTGFNFNIPSDAVITGIVATFKVKKEVALGNAHVERVSLVIDGLITDTNRATSEELTTSFQSKQYGSTTDLWNQFISPEEVNSNQFGIVFSSVSIGTDLSVDYCELELYYYHSSGNQSGFSGFIQKRPSLCAGEFVLEDSKFPLELVQLLYRIPYSENTCISRIEESEYQINVFGLSSEEVDSILDDIESEFNFTETFEIGNRRFSGIHFNARGINEPESNFWHGFISYLLYCEKDLSSAARKDYTSASNIRKAFLQRYEEYDEIRNVIDKFGVGLQLEDTRLPFINIPFLSTQTNSHSTQEIICDNKVKLEIYSLELEEVESCIDAIHNVFDFAAFLLPRSTLAIQWEMDEVTEKEPGLWNGIVSYNVITERLIDGN